MEHVAFIPSADQLNYTFGGAAPVMRIRPGTVLTLWTEDAYGGRITSRDDVATRALDTDADVVVSDLQGLSWRDQALQIAGSSVLRHK